MDRTDEELDLAEAESLHEYDDSPSCNHACCLRLREAVRVLSVQARYVPQTFQSWVLEDGRG